MQRRAGEALSEAVGLSNDLRHYHNHSERYIAEMQSHDDSYVGANLDWVATQLTSLVGPEGRLLELGCGGGSATNAIAARLPGYHRTGLDISEPAIVLASERFQAPNLTYRCGDGLDLPFADASLDAVLSRDALEHLPEVGRALDEMARVLEPGGVASIRSPHHRRPLFALFDLLRRRPDHPFTTIGLGNLPRRIEQSADFTAKLFAKEPRFRYRVPDLSDDVMVGMDSDAVYELSSLDLATFFENRDFAIPSIGSTYGEKWASALVPRLLPDMASIGLAAQSPR